MPDPSVSIAAMRHAPLATVMGDETVADPPLNGVEVTVNVPLTFPSLQILSSDASAVFVVVSPTAARARAVVAPAAAGEVGMLCWLQNAMRSALLATPT